jgi:quinolinate synthase
MSVSNVNVQFEPHANVTALSEAEIAARTLAAKRALGSELLILGHHYQRDPVIRFADKTGDSYGLSRYAAETRDARWVVFCGVHFMAETADILTGDNVTVLLPDLKAGCSMADMADIDQVETCWDEYRDVASETLVPVTYMNSTAAIKAFTGAHGGTVCTSSNAERAMRWAFEQGQKILFLPDQHLGRNTAFFKLGIGLDEMILWDPKRELGGNTPEAVRRARVPALAGPLQRARQLPARARRSGAAARSRGARHRPPGVRLRGGAEGGSRRLDRLHHQDDRSGAGRFIVGGGTEHNLVSRLAAQHPEQTIHTLSPFACQCATMFRIDPVDLMRSLEGIPKGELRFPIHVPERVATDARVALERMLALPPA